MRAGVSTYISESGCLFIDLMPQFPCCVLLLGNMMDLHVLLQGKILEVHVVLGKIWNCVLCCQATRGSVSRAAGQHEGTVSCVARQHYKAALCC